MIKKNFKLRYSFPWELKNFLFSGKLSIKNLSPGLSAQFIFMKSFSSVWATLVIETLEISSCWWYLRINCTAGFGESRGRSLELEMKLCL